MHDICTIQEEKLNNTYRIKLTKSSGYLGGCYVTKVTQMRLSPRGNYDGEGCYRGSPNTVAYYISDSILEALIKYAKLRQVWRHCYS